MEGIALSGHAVERSAQRNISESDIDFVVANGHQIHRTGVIFCQLRKKNVPRSLPGNHRYRQLVGTTVVMCRCGHVIITVYREASAFQRDARKSKYNFNLDIPPCPCCCS